jgi:ABC-type nitrate/sulfonate/bicarbonate transport system ATPase subunit
MSFLTRPAEETPEKPPQAVIEVRGAHAHYSTASGPLPVLNGVDLTVRSGEVLAVVGPSGCGKTTLLRVLQGLTTLDAGSATIRGRGPESTATDSGYVFQQPSLFPWWSVRKNIEFGLRLRSHARRLTASQRRGQADRLLDMVGLTGFHDFRPAALSGGMQQRVNLARALAIDPVVLLLDEPFSAVDTLTRERLQRVLSQTLDALGTAAVIVTHDIHEAVFLGDRVAVMSERPGRIVETFEVGEDRPRSEAFQHSEYLGAVSARIYERLKSSDERASESEFARKFTRTTPVSPAGRSRQTLRRDTPDA